MLKRILPFAIILTACGGSEEGQPLTQQAAISECGGFVATARTAAADYCDAEVLEWSYDAETARLTVVDNRIILNCCGDHSMSASLVDGVYVIQERDAPEGGDGRCNCMCVFDYSLEIDDVPVGLIAVRLIRDVTDDGGEPAVVFDGTFDLAAGSGSEILDATSAEPWCGEASELVQTSTTSECGGFAATTREASTAGYCDAEVLAWSYDADSGSVSLADERMLLNCCGDHSISASLVDGVYVLEEVDAPEGGAGRCDCMCVFDFAIELAGVGPGSMPIRILRDVTDQGDGQVLVWEGSIDLGLGSGAEIIDDSDIGMWCEE